MDGFELLYYIHDGRLWLSIDGQAHLPIEPNELVASFNKRILDLEERIALLEGRPSIIQKEEDTNEDF